MLSARADHDSAGDPPPDALRARVVDLEGEVARLTLRVKDLQQQLWGRKAERGLGGEASGAAALSLFATVEATLPETPTAVAASPLAPRRERPGPTPLDPALPREVIALPDPPVTVRRCPVTGAPLQVGFTERLEVLARRPATYVVKRYERTVWVSPAKTAPLATPWPAEVLPRARMHVSVVAHLTAAHYAEHLPFYRLEQQLAHRGHAGAQHTARAHDAARRARGAAEVSSRGVETRVRRRPSRRARVRRLVWW